MKLGILTVSPEIEIKVAVKQLRSRNENMDLQVAYVRGLIHPASGRLNDRDHQRLVREIKIWSTLDHPNILPFVGFHLSDSLDEALLITPYEPRGSVVKYVKDTQPDDLERFRLVSMLSLQETVLTAQ